MIGLWRGTGGPTGALWSSGSPEPWHPVISPGGGTNGAPWPQTGAGSTLRGVPVRRGGREHGGCVCNGADEAGVGAAAAPGCIWGGLKFGELPPPGCCCGVGRGIPLDFPPPRPCSWCAGAALGGLTVPTGVCGAWGAHTGGSLMQRGWLCWGGCAGCKGAGCAMGLVVQGGCWCNGAGCAVRPFVQRGRLCSRDVCAMGTFVQWGCLWNGAVCAKGVFVQWDCLCNGVVCAMGTFVSWGRLCNGDICARGMFVQWGRWCSGAACAMGQLT